MEPIINKAKSFEEADIWDIRQHISMTPTERQAAPNKLKERVFGNKTPDIRAFHKTK